MSIAFFTLYITIFRATNFKFMTKGILGFLLLAMLLIFSTDNSIAQVVINEFAASNTGYFVDPDYNESSD